MSTSPVIVALDFRESSDADALVGVLGNSADFYKVGMELYAAAGMDYVQTLLARRKKVFLDLKFYDIGETVRRAVSQVARTGVTFLSIHAVPQVVRAAVQGRGNSSLKLLAVTVLTSLDQADIDADGYTMKLTDLVTLRAKNAIDCGADGLIGSPLEARRIRTVVGPGPLLVTPGVRSKGADTGDQKRVATPSEAVHDGADYIVVGRQVNRAVDPVSALAAIHSELGL